MLANIMPAMSIIVQNPVRLYFLKNNSYTEH